ncbi:MAG: DUF3857 domain-containing protein [Aurantibacter sp.]
MRIFFLPAILLIASMSFGQEGIYQAVLLDKTLTENADAVVRSDELIVDLESRNEMVVKRRKIVTVLNKKGNAHAVAYVGYDEGRKVKDIQATIYSASGKELDKIRESKFKDISAVDGSTLYSDSRYKYFHYTPAQYPYTLELTYEIRTRNTGEIRPLWPFLPDFMVSTQNSKIQINYQSPALKPVIKEMNLARVDVAKSETSTSITYEAKNIAAIKKESLCPGFIKIAPHIKIRPVEFQYGGYNAKINDWNDLGRWMHENLLSGRDELSSVTKDRVLALVKDVTDDLEKAKIVYKYVQDNTRYISVQVGIGGIQPISAVEVDRVKYGDCKGLSNYTKALLEVVGVKSYYTHVEAGRDKVDFDDEFPDLAQGNHVILAIPYGNRYYWIDCTSQIHPFGFIGDFTDDRKVLIIKPDGGEIATTTSYIDEQNYQKTTGTYSLQNDGSIKGDLTINTQGVQYDNHFGLEKQPKEEISKYYKNYWDNINNLNVKSYSFQNNRESIVFTEKVSIEAANYASKSGDRILFAANAFNKNKYLPKRYRSRKLPFEIQRGFLDEDEVAIVLPEGYEIEAVPEAIEIENKFGSYSSKYEESQDGIILKRKLFIKSGTYPNIEYGAYRDFMKDISKWDSSKIVIKSDL